MQPWIEFLGYVEETSFSGYLHDNQPKNRTEITLKPEYLLTSKSWKKWAHLPGFTQPSSRPHWPPTSVPSLLSHVEISCARVTVLEHTCSYVRNLGIFFCRQLASATSRLSDGLSEWPPWRGRTGCALYFTWAPSRARTSRPALCTSSNTNMMQGYLRIRSHPIAVHFA